MVPAWYERVRTRRTRRQRANICRSTCASGFAAWSWRWLVVAGPASPDAGTPAAGVAAVVTWRRARVVTVEGAAHSTPTRGSSAGEQWSQPMPWRNGGLPGFDGQACLLAQMHTTTLVSESTPCSNSPLPIKRLMMNTIMFSTWRKRPAPTKSRKSFPKMTLR